MQTAIQRPNEATPPNIPGFVKSSCRTPAVVKHNEPCEADSPVSANGRCEGTSDAREGREGRERLGAQLPANTRAQSISPRPSDTTSNSPFSAKRHVHTSPPCHLPCAPSSLGPLLRSPVRVKGEPKTLPSDAASFWVLFAPQLTRGHTHTRTHCPTHPLIADSVTARGV